MFRLSGVLVLPHRRQVPGGDVALIGQCVQLLIQFLEIHDVLHGHLLGYVQFTKESANATSRASTHVKWRHSCHAFRSPEVVSSWRQVKVWLFQWQSDIDVWRIETYCAACDVGMRVLS